MIVRVKVRGARKGARHSKYEYEETYFSPRQYPQAVIVGGQAIVGPFCEHCGSPETLHGQDKRRRADTCPPPPPIGTRTVMDRRPDARLL